MTNFEEKVNVFFENCSKVDKIIQSIDVIEQRKGYREITKSFKQVMTDLENTVNIFGVYDLRNLFSEKRVLIKLFYVILKSVYIIDTNFGYFSDDARSTGSGLLARKLMLNMQFYQGLRYADAWLHNDEIFTKGIILGMKGCHKTSLQSIVRCMSNTMKMNEFKNQKISSDMQRFERSICYFLEEAPQNEKVFLDYI